MTVDPAASSARGRGRPAGAGKRAAVLRAARESFGEVGYERTTLRDIADRAGVTHPAVSYHFGGKRDLYEKLLQSAARDMARIGAATAAEDDDPQRRVAAFLRAGAAFDADDRSIARFTATSLLESFRYPELAGSSDAQLDEVRAFLRRVLREGTESGALRSDLEIDPTAEMLLAVMWGVALHVAFVGGGNDPEAIVGQFSRLLDGTLW